MSIFLCSRLQAYPLLYYAVEEGLECSKLGHYSSGILAVSQLLNVMNVGTPSARHKVAHELLKHRASRADFDAVLEQIKVVTKGIYEKEREKEEDPVAYAKRLQEKHTELMGSLHPKSATELEESARIPPD